jgi:hypothetical protein
LHSKKYVVPKLQLSVICSAFPSLFRTDVEDQEATPALVCGTVPVTPSIAAHAPAVTVIVIVRFAGRLLAQQSAFAQHGEQGIQLTAGPRYGHCI